MIIKDFEKYEHLFRISRELGDWKTVFENKEINIKGEKKYLIGERAVVSGIARRFLIAEDFRKGRMKNIRMRSLLEEMRGRGEAGTFNEMEIDLNIGCKKDIEIKERLIIDGE